MKLTKDAVNNAIITQLTNVRPHPNADRLQLSTVLGNTVVVGLDAKEGDAVVYFDSNLKLSPAYLKANNLYTKSELNSDVSRKGFFGSNGRVKAVKLRGEISNGYVASLSSIAEVIGAQKNTTLKPGVEFTHIDGHLIADKYVKPHDRWTPKKQKQPSGQAKYAAESVSFHQHWSTKHFQRMLDKIPAGPIYISEKLHGTSGRIGLHQVARSLSFCERWAQRLGINVATKEWKAMHGSRRVVLKADRKESDPFYKGNMRELTFNKLKPHLRKGETLYFEIVGFETSGGCVQKGFAYGCKPGEHGVYLYRVTQTNEDGESVDMSPPYVQHRAEELGIKAVPQLKQCYWNGEVRTMADLVKAVGRLTDGTSTVDQSTMREGVCVWFMNKGKWTCLKNKSEAFLLAESGAMDKPDYEDKEA